MQSWNKNSAENLTQRAQRTQRGVRLSALRDLCVRCSAIVLFLAIAGDGWAQDASAPIKNLRIPLEHYEDGKVRTQITAGTASVAESGNITAAGVKIEIYARDGSVESRAEAGDCYVDRESQVVTSTNTVRVTQKGVAITGTGFEWHAGEQSFKIQSEARVVFVRSPGLNLWNVP